MRQLLFHAPMWLAAAASAVGPAGAAAALPGGNGPGEPPRERVVLLDNRQYEGLIESQDGLWLNLIQIERPPGRSPYLVIRPIELASVLRVERLDEARRAELERWVDQFVNRARIQAARAEAVQFGWVQRHGIDFHQYRGRWFTLESSADEEITRQIVVRMEQVFTAYRQLLPPRVEPRRPLQVIVFGSSRDYREQLRRLGVSIPSPGCFLPTANQVLAGTELGRLAAEVAKTNRHNERRAAEIRQTRALLPRRLAELNSRLRAEGLSDAERDRARTNALRRWEEEIKRQEKELQEAMRRNRQEIDKATRQVYTLLYHEAFHAYLENYVYPSERYDVPAWLNEGLAQVFEAGVLESDALRIDAPNAAALERLRADFDRQAPLPLGALLAAGPEKFLAGEPSETYYAHAWGLAHYLAFERGLLDAAALDEFVAPHAAATPPVERFEKLVGAPLAEFEAAWRQYVRVLK
jgi:hypothetical protein